MMKNKKNLTDNSTMEQSQNHNNILESIKDTIKKISALTKVLCKDYIENLPVFNGKNSTQGKLFKICIVIVIFGLTYLSYKIIGFLEKTGQPQIFLNIYLLIMAMIVIFQQIIASTNIYYFSKDLEYILPLPIKPIELLISRFNMLMCISYSTMILFGFIPLLIYGLIASTSIFYYPGMFIVLLTFPIFFGLIVSTVMLFVMQLSKIIKNKDVFQFIITMLMMGIITIFEATAINKIFSNVEQIEQIQAGEAINLIEVMDDKIVNINDYLITLNSSVKLLIEENLLSNSFELLKIILVNIIAICIFIFIGKRLYLKNILKNIQKVNIPKTKRKDIKHKYKKTNKNKAYIKNEFRELIKTPAFFMQCIFPIVTIVIILAIIIVSMYPSLVAIMQDEELTEQIDEITFELSMGITIIIIAQMIFTFSNLSITAISRKGKNAFFIKYIPIPLYKQFLYLNIPQVTLNILVSIVVLGVTKYLVQEISILNLLLLFIIITLLNILNSFLMLIVDLNKPNLEWDNETDAIKQNQNKLYQYVLTIFLILILVYFAQVFEKINLYLALAILIGILFIILFFINLIINKKEKKLFKKII